MTDCGRMSVFADFTRESVPLVDINIMLYEIIIILYFEQYCLKI